MYVLFYFAFLADSITISPSLIQDSDGKQQLIYKHAISTVVPPKPIELELDT